MKSQRDLREINSPMKVLELVKFVKLKTAAFSYLKNQYIINTATIDTGIEIAARMIVFPVVLFFS